MRHTLVLFGCAIALIVGWGILFSVFENVGWETGLYWAVTTATTVGYGDVTPHATSGHVLAIGCMLTAIPMIGACFAMLTSAHVRKHMRRHVDDQLAAHHERQAARDELILSGVRNLLLLLHGEGDDGPAAD